MAADRFQNFKNRILFLRGRRVMLGGDVAEIYGVDPKVLVQAAKRHLDRFPDDFLFQLTRGEYEELKSQSVISSWGGARRAMPCAFTAQGVAMLAAVLTSTKAVRAGIEFVRASIRLGRTGAEENDARRDGESECLADLFEIIRRLRT